MTLNDPAHMEFAQDFAKKILSFSGDLDQQLAPAYKEIALSEPKEYAMKTLKKLHRNWLVEFSENPTEAKKRALTPAEAVMVMIANTLLNSDIALNR